MNDKGKTVISIEGVSPSYHRFVKRGKKPERRCIRITMDFNLNPDFPGEHGWAATMHAIREVTDRVINTCAKEFLP